jgi:hypothetical protein
MAASVSSSLPGGARLLSTPDTVPEAPNTGSNSHKAGNIVGLGNQVKALLPTPVTDPESANGHARDLGGEIRLLPTTTAMDSEASGGSSAQDVTLTDAVVRTQLGAIENPRHLLRTPAAAEAEGGPRDRNRAGATMRLSDQIREEMEDGNIALLPTPSVANSHGNDRNSRGELLLPGVATQLLPTPVAQPSGNTPEEHLRKKPGREVVTDLAIIAENGLIESGGRLLPTPEAKNGTASPDYARARRTGSGGDDLATATHRLLPTPNVAMADGGQTSRSGDRKGEPLLGGIAVEQSTDWGPYTAAIARWEAVIGRPAPNPVRNDGKGGKPRLNPELTEWMMGWPAGWVTAAVFGLKRAEQLKACGNGVVTLQAVAALRIMLARPGVPHIHYGLAA